MTRTLLALTLALLIAGCAAAPVDPTPPDRPECLTPDKDPIDGGLGGTGRSPDDPCAEERQGRATPAIPAGTPKSPA